MVEDIARKRACQLFGADHANVQPHCGANANYAVYAALCEHGDTVLGMDLANGGHLTHGSPVNFSGKNYNIVAYGVNDQGYIDYDQVRDLAKKHRPPPIPAPSTSRPLPISPTRWEPICLWIWPISLAWWLWGSTPPRCLMPT